MLQFDPGVRIGLFHKPLRKVLFEAANWAAARNKIVVVFSVQDKTHGPGSLHPLGLAVDLDVMGNDAAELYDLYNYLRVILPPGFDVIFENNHVHVEWDMHRPKAALPPSTTPV